MNICYLKLDKVPGSIVDPNESTPDGTKRYICQQVEDMHRGRLIGYTGSE
jgi:hypothetical protein